MDPDIPHTADVTQRVIEILFFCLAFANFAAAVLLVSRKKNPVLPSDSVRTHFFGEKSGSQDTTYQITFVGASVLVALGVECILIFGLLRFRTGAWLTSLVVGQVGVSLLLALGIWQESRRWVSEQIRASVPCYRPNGWLIGGLWLGLAVVFGICWFFVRGTVDVFLFFRPTSMAMFEWLWAAGVIIPIAGAISFALVCRLSCKP